MSIYKELSYNQNIDTIKGVQFSIMSSSEIKKRSVAEILTTDTYAGNEPIHGGLFDPRMGVIDHNKICTTCEQKNNFCPGHFGHIELARPLFYIQYLDTIKKLLKCICFHCSKLLIDKNLSEMQIIINKKIGRQKKFEAIYKICSKNKIKECPYCSIKQPDKIIKENMGKIIMEWKKDSSKNNSVNNIINKSDNINETENTETTIIDNKTDTNNNKNNDELIKEYYAEEILKIFERITDEDSEIIGFPKSINRPENLICTVFPVCPPSVRPSVTNDTGQRCHDDLTHKLCDIIKTNNSLKTKIEKGSTTEQIDYWTTLLQYHLSTFIDNKTPNLAQAKQRSGRPLRSLTERLKSKEGRIRGNLMGKRVDFSARSVITPDPSISINELGVPIKIAMNLTYPEKVNKFNKDKLIKLIKNGPDKYPGAKFLRKTNDNMRTIRLKEIDISKIQLDIGDIVDRHVINGDVVLFNRQPSLHKMSMMAHIVKVMPYDTFRLNPAVTPSYNADYDGDEMNLHLPQSIQTENELKMLANVSTQIISPRQSKPIISVVQDVTLGIYRITKDHIEINEKQLFNLLMSNSKFYGKIPEPEIKITDNIYKWTGKQVMSQIIPKNVNIINGNTQYDADRLKDDKQNLIKIENGEIKQGVFDKKIYQDRTNGLIHYIHNEISSKEAHNLFDNTQKLICDWLVYSGFSVGLSDLYVLKKTNDEMNEVLKKMKNEVYKIIQEIHKNKFENNSFDTNNVNFENEVNKLLNNAIGKVGKIALNNITDENRMVNMIRSKAKGNPVNIAQMISSLGQQNVDGKRITDGYDDRTLPHYTKYDDGPEARGFVENSFINGLTPQEFFFHAMGGREGLIDTAIKTAETGYIQRKLIKSMEDCKISYDLTVRNANGSIIQFLYGEDGINAIKLESQSLGNFIDKNYGEMEEDFLLRLDDIPKSLYKKKIFEDIIKNKEKWEKDCEEHFKEILIEKKYLIEEVFRNQLENSILTPISFKRLIINIKQKFMTKFMKSDLKPDYVLEKLNEINKTCIISKNNNGNKLFKLLANINLSPKQVIIKHKLNMETFDYIIENIKLKFKKSIAHPSEMVGVVAAQSIGEPCTQLVLNTFHASGISSASQTVRGVPRVKELLSVSKNIKGPSTKIYIKENKNHDRTQCKNILNSLETTYIKDIIKKSSIYYDPKETETSIENDIEFIKIYKQFEELNTDCNEENPWLLRFEFDEQKMFDLGITMTDIYYNIYNIYEEQIKCYYSDDNSKKLIFRIKFNNKKNKKDKKNEENEESNETDDVISELKALEDNIINNIIIKGISGIKKVILLENKMLKYNKLEEKFINYQEWFMDTNGNNLFEILCHPDVDFTRTISNDVNEVYEILGIEAARQVLYNEINEVLKDVGVNYRHMSLLVDTMTNRGALLSIDRHGINRSDIGPFAKCSFEETSDMLIKAGIFGEYDKMNGVSANIMTGQVPPCGTGDTEILIDTDKIKLINDVKEKEQNIDDNNCTIDNLSFNFEIINTENSNNKFKDLDIKF
jgi:DNA-directed RNA polymerase II subunit RPB1